jgi:hypothetical protein
MPGQTLQLNDVMHTDDLAKSIADTWRLWNNFRQEKIGDWEEIRSYLYATDTTHTDVGSLPWKNKTTFPKLTQIADNLHANYLKSLFPQRQWMVWEGYDKQSEDAAKKSCIENYMVNATERSGFKATISQLLWDWIHYGNCFGMPEWFDARVELDNKIQTGYVGPRIQRISPLDIVFNPIATSFAETPKIVRRWVNLGDLKTLISRLSDNDTHAKEIHDYLLELRSSITAFAGEITSEDEYLKIDGFTDFRSYLGSDYAEVLTFYGDLFDRNNNKFYRNHVITIVDRHKLISIEPNKSFFGFPPIFHCGWRTKSDNLWAMGPLDNLVGMQYRIDHLENLKADVFDLNAFPPLKIKGYVDDFEWGPMERIYVSEEGDVEMVNPHFEILNANLEIDALQEKMELIAGAPKEAMGIRSPGEKTKYEVQRLESAASRIFQSKIELFEEQMIETNLTGMLELARRKVSSDEIRIFDDELKIATFQTLSAADITGTGRLKPIAARHFAEQAERVQNWSNFTASPAYADPAVSVHLSGLAIAKMFEEVLDGKQYKLFTPFVRLAEQAEGMKLQNATQEDVLTQAGTPSGLTPEDYSA